MSYSLILHFLFVFWKDSLFLIPAGICSQIFAPKYDTDSGPLYKQYELDL